MFRTLGFVLVTALSLGGAEAGKKVLDSLLDSILVVVQRAEVVSIQKQLLVNFHETGRLPAPGVAKTGPLYGFLREKMSAAGRDPGLDYWESPYWYATGKFYRHQLDAMKGQFAIGSPGPDRIAFTRDDVYVINQGS